MLPKNVLSLLQKRAEVIQQKHRDTDDLRQQIDALQKDLDAVSAPHVKKLAELQDKIIEAVTAEQDTIFADKASHTHAGQKVMRSTSKAVKIEDEALTVQSLLDVRGAQKDKALSFLKIETSVNKAAAKAQWDADGEFLAAHGVQVISTTSITLKDG